MTGGSNPSSPCRLRCTVLLFLCAAKSASAALTQPVSRRASCPECGIPTNLRHRRHGVHEGRTSSPTLLAEQPPRASRAEARGKWREECSAAGTCATLCLRCWTARFARLPWAHVLHSVHSVHGVAACCTRLRVRRCAEEGVESEKGSDQGKPGWLSRRGGTR